MKYIKYFTSGSGVLLALICFFFPWIIVVQNGRELGRLSGFQFASNSGDISGFLFEAVSIFYLIPIFVLVSAVFLAVSEMRNSAARVVSGFGQIGLVIISYVGLGLGWGQLLGDSVDASRIIDVLFNSETITINNASIGLDAVWGIWGIIIGLTLIFIGGILTFIQTSNLTIEQAEEEWSPTHASSRFAYDQHGGPSFPLNTPDYASPTPQGHSSNHYSSQAKTIDVLPETFVQQNKEVAVSSYDEQPSPSIQQTQHPPLPQAHTVVLNRGPQKKSNAWLIVREGEGVELGQSFNIPQDDVLELGRATQSGHVLLADTSSSSRHAAVRCEEDGYFLIDLASTNGTFVKKGDDWEKVYRYSLNDGDLIKIGRSIFAFVHLETQTS